MKTSYKNSKKITLLTIISCLIFGLSFSQETTQKQKSDFWKHVRFGGGIGLSTSNGIFSATLAPSAIYQFDNAFALGIGISGSYLSRKNIFKSTIIGGSLIGLYNPINEIQLSGELEQNNVSRNYNDTAIKDENYWSPALFLGAGFRTRNITIGVKYDVLYNKDKSIYADPWMPFIRVYF